MGAITIADLAEQAADFFQLYADLDEIKEPAEEARKSGEAIEERAAADQVVQRIERTSTISFARNRALQDLILTLEPHTLSEVLSLTLVVIDKLADIESGAIEGNKAEVDDLRRALLAVARGMVGSGATSPLLDVLTARIDMMPFEDARALAAADIERLLGPEREQ